MDAVMPLLRDKFFWIPVYVVLIAYLLGAWGRRKGLFAVAFVLWAVIFANTLSAELIKPLVGRARPCQAWPEVRPLVDCGGGKSFPSAHAANHFALSTALWLVWPGVRRRRYTALGLGLWAGSVSFAQVYVGVHYPFDVLAGALMGVLGTVFWWWVWRKWPLFGQLFHERA